MQDNCYRPPGEEHFTKGFVLVIQTMSGRPMDQFTMVSGEKEVSLHDYDIIMYCGISASAAYTILYTGFERNRKLMKH